MYGNTVFCISAHWNLEYSLAGILNYPKKHVFWRHSKFKNQNFGKLVSILSFSVSLKSEMRPAQPCLKSDQLFWSMVRRICVGKNVASSSQGFDGRPASFKGNNGKLSVKLICSFIFHSACAQESGELAILCASLFCFMNYKPTTRNVA